MTAASRADQWALVSMQVVNWGGFNGHKSIRFAPPGEATVISGKTGSGKSTLMDANTVLMHPGKRLNRASNEVVGAGRSVVSYMRGHLDKTITAAGVEKRLMLRGEHLPTWSAIAQTWRSSEGEYLTVFAAYYVRPSDVKPVRRFGHCPGELNLQQLAKYVGGEYASNPLRPQAIRADFPSIEFVASHEALRQWLFDQIGIAHNAKRLTDTLYRIQTSGPIGSVHQLFESLVLDKPEELIDLLNRSRSQWTETQNTHREVADREAKAALLEAIPDLWGRYQENQDNGAFFGAIGFGALEADTPFWLWVRTRQGELLDAAEQEITGQWHAAEQNAISARKTHGEARTAWQTAARVFLDQGGGGLQEETEKLRVAEERVQNVLEDRRLLSADMAGVMRLPHTTDEVEQQRVDSNRFMATYDDAKSGVREQVKQATGQHYSAEQELARLRNERAYYVGRTDAIPPRFDEVRKMYAARSSIPVADLRFVGELIDMEPEWDQWRTAAELAIGGFANILLVPAGQASRFREAVDGPRTDVRLNSLVVPDQPQPLADVDASVLAGRFMFREHRYSGWLSQQIASRFNHLCVEDGAALNALAKGVRGVSLQGQVRDGERGAHGGQEARNRPRIGFSAASVVDDLDEKIRDADEDAMRLQRAHAEAQGKLDKVEQNMRAHRDFLRAAGNWARYDEQAALAEIDTLTARIEALRSDERLARLEAEMNRLSQLELDASMTAQRLETTVENLAVERIALMQRKDHALDHLERMQAAQVAEPEMSRLDSVLLDLAESDTITVAQFNPRQLGELATRLKWLQGMASREANNYRERLVTTFDKYLKQWETLGLDTDPDLYYEKFAEIREHNSLIGLPEAKEKFAQNVMRFTTMTASSIHDSYADAKKEIRERLERINALLAEQEFGAGNSHRLHIEPLRDAMPEETREFLSALAGLGAYTTKSVGYEEMVERYERFERFMDLVETEADVDRLFDVRKHVYLHALETRPESDDPITHDTFGEKSGGEYQELCAFVLAAAVRYQVGSQGERVPRFAPVFLDEGLIKADPEVTRRAVNVWKDLGFQPIIAVPLDKHESVMVASSWAWMVSKDTHGRSRVDFADKKSAQ